MTQQKKKNFGLAAQLAQPRPSTLAETPPVPRPAQSHSYEPPLVTAAGQDMDGLEWRESPSSESSEHTNHTKRRSSREKKPGARPREGGYVRRTITLAPGLSDYVDRAWRTYRTPGGKYVKGVSGFIEAVIDEHRHRAK